MSQLNGIYPVQLHTHESCNQFLHFLKPYHVQARKEGLLATFLDLGFTLRANRFFVTDDLNPECVPCLTQKKQQEFKQAMRTVGWHTSLPPCIRWETDLTLEADRDRRRKEYLHAARYGRYLRGHQYQVAITDEDRAAEKTPEERIQEAWHGLMHCIYGSNPQYLEKMLTEPYYTYT